MAELMGICGADAEAARMSARQVATDLDALRKRLTDESEIEEAEKLAGSVREFLDTLR